MKLPSKIDLQDKKVVPSPEVKPETVSPQIKSKKFLSKIKLPRLPKSVKIGLLVLLGFFLFLILVTGVFALSIKKQTQSASSSISQITTSVQEKDLIAVNQHLDELEASINKIQSSYKIISWLRFIPFYGGYLKDGQAVLTASHSLITAGKEGIKAIEPYSDLLGFKVDQEQEDKPEFDSIENRIIFLAETLDKISPQLDGIAEHLEVANQSLSKIKLGRYPNSFLGKSIRPKIYQIQSGLSDTATLMVQAKPLIKLLPTLLGNPDPKLYMLLFQNDAEIRPTGGFMTAYAYIKVSQGKIEPLGSYDIYDLDARWSGSVKAPEAIQKYLNETYWNLRNMNLSPDFKSSMDTFMENYRDIPGLTQIDGIIAIDTSLPVEILKIIGPIGVSGWGNFSAENDSRCDCPQVVYALEEIADRPGSAVRVGRKAVLGPLMHSLLANAMGSPKHLWPTLLNVGLDSINQKHLLFYFMDETTQSIAEDFNAAGRITEYDQDYLHVNDSNFGGAKSDLFIQRDVEQEIEVSGGTITKIVTLNYNNPEPGSNCNLEAGELCLNGTYRDWVRLYVPLGSELISVVGSEVEEKVGEDLGKTVFEVFFTMRPQSSSKLVFTYRLPFALQEPYRLFIQKQPGKPAITHSIIYNGTPFEYAIDFDQELVLE